MSQDDNQGETDSSNLSRRKLLELTGLGTAGAMGGCLGDGGGTPTDQATPQPTVKTIIETVEGETKTVIKTKKVTREPEPTESPTDSPTPDQRVDQELRLATGTDPLTTSFLQHGPWGSYYDSQLNMGNFGPLTDEYVYINEPPVGDNSVIEGRMFDDWTLNFDEGLVEVTLRDDAMWSDGEPVTAADYLAQAAFFRLAELSGPDGGNSFMPRIGSVGLRWSWEDYNLPDGMDGKTIQFTADRDGAWDHLDEIGALFDLSGIHMAPQPSHKEPISELLEVSLENLEIAQKNPGLTDQWKQRSVIMSEVVTDEDLENWRDPDFAVFNGPWQLEEVRGSQEIIFSPNDYHYASDQVNWDQITYEFMPDDNRRKASLQSGILDSGSQQFTAGAIKNLPSKYEQINQPAGGRGVIGFDHTHFAFGDQRVRQAIAYAIDSETVAKNVHPRGTVPFNTPGGDNAYRSQVISDQWVNDNLTNYAQDTDEATSKMQAAGFTKSDDQWEKDGKVFAPTFFTDSGSPIFEKTVASQLSNFGINTQVQTVSTGYGDRFHAGEFDMFVPFRGPYLANPWGDLGHFFYATNIHSDWENTWNYYSAEAQEKMFDAFGESGWIGGNTAATKVATIQAPPIGQPNGELQTWRPTFWYASSSFGSEGPWYPKTADNYYKPLAWIFNWFLPGIPIYSEVEMNWINADNWVWPREDPMWDFYGAEVNTGDYVSLTKLMANADNPK